VKKILLTVSLVKLTELIHHNVVVLPVTLKKNPVVLVLFVHITVFLVIP